MKIINCLKDNRGSLYMENMVLIVIAFVAGAILWGIISTIFAPGLSGGIKNVVQGIFNS